MDCFVVFRRYDKEDELQCKKLLKNETRNLINQVFFKICGLKNTVPIFIFISLAMLYFVVFTDIYYIMVIPVALIILFVRILAKMWKKICKIQQEVSDIIKIYMSDKSTCFWVAETFTRRSIDTSKKDYYCIFISEQEFNDYDINVFAYDRKIIATIGLCKHNNISNAAMIKRLFVHEGYRRVRVGSRLLNEALIFAYNNDYDCVNIMISKYMEEAVDMVIRKGFQLHTKHKLNFYNSLMAIPNYEFTYPLERNLKENSYVRKQNDSNDEK